MQAPGVSQRQGRAQGQRGSQQGQLNAVPCQFQELAIHGGAIGLRGPDGQLRRRDDEPEPHWQGAQGQSQPAPPAMQSLGRDAAVATAGVVIARLLARAVFQDDQRQHEAHQQGGELRGGDAAAQAEPGSEDAGGESGHAEVLHDAVIRQGFH